MNVGKGISAAVQAARTGRSRPAVPLAVSYWASPGWLLAGNYPGETESAAADHKLDRLLDAGIRSFVNLMEETEYGHDGRPFTHYDQALRLRAAERGVDVQLARFPIEDVSVTTTAQMQRILQWIDDEIEAGRPVYVHCRGGVGRTGTVVGCWLARHGVAVGDQALRQIESLRAEVANRIYRSPETEEQRAMVRGWRPLAGSGAQP